MAVVNAVVDAGSNLLGQDIDPYVAKYVDPANQVAGTDYKSNLSAVPPTTYMPASNTDKYNLYNEKWMEIFKRPMGKEGADFYLNSDKSLEELEAEWRASEEAQNIAAGGQPVVGDPYGGPVTADDIQQIFLEDLGRAAGKTGIEFYLNSNLSKEEIRRQVRVGDEYARIQAGGTAAYVDPSEQYAGVNYRYNVDPRTDPTAATTRGQTGLTGAENEYQRALYSSEKGLGKFEDVLSPWAEGGKQAYDVQLALSGALGPEAQAEAYKNYKESPGQDWLREESMRQVENYAAATGQSLGGNVLDEINRRAMGLAMQGYGADFDRLGGVAAVGGQAANVLGQGYLGSGQFDAGLMARLGDLRYQKSTDELAALGQGVTSLAGLQAGQGAMDAATYAHGTGAISNVINDVANQLGQSPMVVANMIINSSMQQGSDLSKMLTAGGAFNENADAAYYESLGNAAVALFDVFDKDED